MPVYYYSPVHALSVAVAVALSLAAGAALAGNATKDEAVAMVKKGITFIKSNGKDKGYAEISNKSGQFIDRDLYLVVYGIWTARCVPTVPTRR